MSGYKVLVQFAHPALERSRVHRRLVGVISKLPGVTVNDLYELYPEFLIDVGREKALLEEHDILIFQHPVFWYSTPSLLKEWQDLVLEYGWAYGTGGKALEGKGFMPVISSGGGEEAYCPTGHNCYTLYEFLKPLEQTARLCHMRNLHPFILYGANKATESELELACYHYRDFLEQLTRGELSLEILEREAGQPRNLLDLLKKGALTHA
jgi:glutathione-regulated potassium-efflux system ancillary protein KefG